MPFRITVPASTSNLGAGVDVLGLSLPLFLTLEVKEKEGQAIGASKAESNLSFSFQDLDIKEEDNLILKAYKEAGGQDLPYEVCVQSQIPLARGLGSSGAAIAAGLLLAERLCPQGRSKEDLLAIGVKLEGHPDNLAASLFGGLTLALKCEEGYQVLRLPFPEPLSLVAVIPNKPISTKDARAVLPSTVPMAHALAQVHALSAFFAALMTQKNALLPLGLDDALFSPHRAKLLDDFDTLKAAALKAGALAYIISGSGSTQIALVEAQAVLNHGCPSDGKVQGVQAALEAVLKEKGRVQILRPYLEGARITEGGLA